MRASSLQIAQDSANFRTRTLWALDRRGIYMCLLSAGRVEVEVPARERTCENWRKESRVIEFKW